MNPRLVTPTGRERTFGEEEVIVSKTDTTGKITYANQVFLRVAGYTEEEVLGQPHSIIRHPDMPRSVFKLLWDTIGAKQEIFAYVVNLAKNGDHYWVFAHVTPTFDPRGTITGYHSNRRKPEAAAVRQVEGIYRILLEEERRHADKREAVAAGVAKLLALLESTGMAYDQFVFSLESRGRAA